VNSSWIVRLRAESRQKAETDTILELFITTTNVQYLHFALHVWHVKMPVDIIQLFNAGILNQGTMIKTISCKTQRGL